jgi:hypothetical protein
VWVLEDWWPTIRDLTSCWEFCSAQHWKRQYDRCIKIYMAYYEEKGESHEDSFELWRFYFICVLGALYYQMRWIGWVSEIQIIKINLLTKVPRRIGHIRVPDRIPEALIRHVRPPTRTCTTLSLSSAAKSKLDLSGFQRGFPPSPHMSDLSTLSWVKASEPDMSSS